MALSGGQSRWRSLPTAALLSIRSTPDVVARWREARQEYSAARAALVGEIERQGWRAPVGSYVDIVFTAAPGGPEDQAAVFIEVEDDQRRSTQYGEWIERDDGYWVLRIPATWQGCAVRCQLLPSLAIRTSFALLLTNKESPAAV